MLKFMSQWKWLLAALFAVSLAGCAVVPYQSSGYIAADSYPYGDFYGTPYSTFGTPAVGIGLQYYGGSGRSHGYRGAHRNRSGGYHHGGGRPDGGGQRGRGGHRGGGHRGR